LRNASTRRDKEASLPPNTAQMTGRGCSHDHHAWLRPLRIVDLNITRRWKMARD